MCQTKNSNKYILAAFSKLSIREKINIYLTFLFLKITCLIEFILKYQKIRKKAKGVPFTIFKPIWHIGFLN